MKLKIIYPFIGIHILLSCIAFSADDCDSWFAKSKIRISEKDCELGSKGIYLDKNKLKR